MRTDTRSLPSFGAAFESRITTSRIPTPRRVYQSPLSCSAAMCSCTLDARNQRPAFNESPSGSFLAGTSSWATRTRRRLPAAAPAAPIAGRRRDDLRPPPDLPGLLAEGDHAASHGDLRAAVRAFRQATYLDPNLAIAYFQLGAALELAGDPREARRAFGAAGLAMMRADGAEDISGLGGYTRRDLARAIASKLTED